jgi:uncharacterized membrane protein
MTISNSKQKASRATAPSSLSAQIEQNVEDVIAMQRQEWDRTSQSQRRVERISGLVGRPIFLLVLLVFVALWIILNLTAPALHMSAFDPWPFQVLDGVLTLTALLVATIVLVAQNRQSKLEQQHTHLALQVNLLTEQKVSKLIHLIEELRQDLPMVQNRRDAEAETLKQTAKAGEVISAIEEVKTAEEQASKLR